MYNIVKFKGRNEKCSKKAFIIMSAFLAICFSNYGTKVELPESIVSKFLNEASITKNVD